MQPAIRVTVSDVHGRAVELIKQAEDLIRDVKADAMSKLDAPGGLRYVMFHDVSASVRIFPRIQHFLFLFWFVLGVTE